MAQQILKAAVQGKDDRELAKRAVGLLIRTASHEAVAPLLRALPAFDEITALAVLTHINRMLGDKKVRFPPNGMSSSSGEWPPPAKQRERRS